MTVAVAAGCGNGGDLKIFVWTYEYCIFVPMAPEPETCDLLCLDLAKAEAVRGELPAAEELEAWAEQARALGDPTRLAIALALAKAESACVCDLAWIVSRDEKLVSHHLRLLKAGGAARSSRDGRMVIYELTEAGRALVEDFVATQAACS